MSSNQQAALVRKIARRIENETANLWEMHPGLSREIVKIVLDELQAVDSLKADQAQAA